MEEKRFSREIKLALLQRIMALTRKEISARHYKNRKSNGLCPRCGNVLDRGGHYCSECLKKIRIYSRENRKFYRENHICTECGKVKVFGDDKICFECRAKKNNRRKPLTEEQKQKYGEHFKVQQKTLYQQRKEQGICTRCGKLKAISGKTKCGICLAKDVEMHRKKNFDKVNIKEYRKQNHLCYYCGNEIDVAKGQLCSNCLERCRQNGLKGGEGNKFWKQENILIFGNGDIK